MTTGDRRGPLDAWDPDSELRLRIVEALIWPGIGATGVLCLLAPVVHDAPGGRLALYVSALGVQVLVLASLRLRRPNLAGALYAGFFFIAATGALLGFGVGGPGSLGFVISVLCAGLLWRREAAMGLAAAAVPAMFAMAAVEALGLYEPPLVAQSWSLFIDGAVAAALAAFLVSFTRREATDASTRARASEERYGRMIAESPDGIVRIDEDGRIRSFNPAAEQFTGFDEGDVRDRLLTDLDGLGSEAISSLIAEVRLAHPDRLPPVDLTLTRAGRPELRLEVQGWVYPYGDGECEIILSMRDVTEARQVEARLARRARMESLGQMAGGVAHDFNNLLTVVVGSAELLTTPEGQERKEQMIERILEAAAGGARLTHQLIAFSRRQVLEPEPTDLNRTIRSMLTMLERLIGEDVQVVLNLEDDLPTVTVDRSQLDQSIMNLCVNARAAMPAGGSLILSTRSFHLDLPNVARDLPPGDYVQITVADDGEGIAPSVQEHIFEPFFTTRGPDVGSGLGLAIVHGFVQQSEGRLWVESEEGVGTTFTLVLRRSQAKPGTVKEPEPAAVRPGMGRILLIEDEHLVRQTTEVALTGAGYQVDGVATPELALALVGGGARYDLVISDVILPGLSGPELVERLVQMQLDPAVLYISGYPADAVELLHLDDPKRGFLPKPFRPSTLTRRVASLLERSGRSIPRAG